MVADWKANGVTVYGLTQASATVRDEIATLFDLPKNKVRVVFDFMGGGFGAKFGAVYGVGAPELSLGRRLDRRSVARTSARSPPPSADRPRCVNESDARVGQGRADPAVKSEAWCAMGAYLEARHARHPDPGGVAVLGPVRDPELQRPFTGVFTHTTPTDAYRGAGRPESDIRPRAGDGCSSSVSSA